ncbi:hypothetical protein [Liquorilactobacillus nagelii]|uniref:hypothetical protein n=1 Tax=Liquorilactobacillus nagelii TaxID=82688 RepID=UPI001CCACF35|nr:hypothetical protein [Liquorilactobacillus nagelii]ULQ49647.1 hypothetical protein J6864_01000 [Liquorilactobacillus nagelii]
MSRKTIKILLLFVLGIVCTTQTFIVSNSNEVLHASTIRHRGKVQKYGQPYGPSWLYVYVNGEKSKSALDPEKNAVVKLGKNDVISFAGKLPLIGKVKTPSFPVASNSEQATLDQSNSFARRFNSVTFVNSDYKLKFEIFKLKNIKAKSVSNMAFSDLTSFLDAVSNNDETKLPNNSSLLEKSLQATNYQGKVQDSYKLEALYFNKKTASNSNAETDHDHDTYLTVGDDSLNNLSNATELDVDVFAKVKKTIVNKDMAAEANSNGDATTEIDEYQMIYRLLDNKKWQLISATSVGESPYALDTSSKSWIVKKVQ